MEIVAWKASFGFLLVALAAAAGCGAGDDWDRQAVSGRVTLDGEPLDAGSIEFRPTKTKDALSGGAVIADGEYEIARDRGLPPGDYQVRINSSDPNAQRPSPDEPPGLMPLVQERIPPQYNVMTTLSAKVTAEGPNEFNFELKSK